jgi:hypothetical protein
VVAAMFNNRRAIEPKTSVQPGSAHGRGMSVTLSTDDGPYCSREMLPMCPQT